MARTVAHQIEAEIKQRMEALDTPRKRVDYLVSRGWRKGRVERHPNYFVVWWFDRDRRKEKLTHAIRLQVQRDVDGDRQRRRSV